MRNMRRAERLPRATLSWTANLPQALPQGNWWQGRARAAAAAPQIVWQHFGSHSLTPHYNQLTTCKFYKLLWFTAHTHTQKI